MPSSPDPLLNLELQAQGENLNVWGAPKLNQALAIIAEAIAGRAAYAVSGSYIPTAANYVSNEARKRIHHITSGTGGTITMPAVSFVKLFANGASGSITVTTGGGTTAVIQAGRSAMVWCDGTNVRKLFDNDAGGAKITNLATGTGSTDAVTKGQLDAVSASIAATAFATQAGSYPDRAGNARKKLGVIFDETSVEWQDVTAGDVVGLSAALDTTLATAKAQAIAFAIAL